MSGFLLLTMCLLVVSNWSDGLDVTSHIDDILERYRDESNSAAAADVLMVELTLVQGADSRGAVCLDGSLPGYHLHNGSESGTNSWLVNLEGGGWCNDIKSCVVRASTRRGSSEYMNKSIPFTGLLSNKAEQNPDFYNWNRVKIRYCDGASFIGEGY